MKKKKIIHYFIFAILFFTIFIFYENKVNADYTAGTCLFCSSSTEEDNELLYKQEKQLLEKIQIIKNTYGSSIDEITLLATILHKEGPQTALGSRYSEDFDSDKYKNKISSEKSWYDGVSGKSEEDIDEYVNEQEEKLDKMSDLLDAAAVIMAESSSGSFNEENYKETLTNDNSLTVCGMAAASLGISAIQLIQGKTTRFDNLSKICANGYIGGVYDINEIKGSTDEETTEKRKQRKERIAEEIIELAHYYKSMIGYEENNCVAGTSSGDYSSWKQYEGEWKDLTIGTSGQTVHASGCLATSLAILMAKSGTKITNLPSGYGSFNPGALITTLNNNDGFSGVSFSWKGWSNIAPNWKDGGFVSVNTSDEKTLAKKISEELSKKAEGKYQKYLILQIHHDGDQEHWVAVDEATSDSLTIMDPGASGTTLSDNYNSWNSNGYRIMYATDVEEQGSSSSETPSNTSSETVCSNGDGTVQNFIEFIGRFEGTSACNYHGQGEGTGYTAEYGNGESWPTAGYGVTPWVSSFIHEQGYTEFNTDIYAGCVSKEKLDKVLPAVVDHLFGDSVVAKAQEYGITLQPNEKYALIGVAYGASDYGSILAAMKKYGKDSDEVLQAFKNSFGRMDLCNGLLRRRLSEYELFMTGNYKAESADYIGYDGCSKGMAMSRSEIKSHWPSGGGTDN